MVAETPEVRGSNLFIGKIFIEHLFWTIWKEENKEQRRRKLPILKSQNFWGNINLNDKDNW